MSRDILYAEALGRYVYLDDAEIAHCSDGVAAQLIAYGLNLALLTEGKVARIIADSALAAAARKGGDVEQAPGEAPQSGGDSRNAQNPEAA